MIVQERDGRKRIYIPTCDICGAELRAEHTFMDAVDAKRHNGWRSQKNENGDWMDVCNDCQKSRR